MIEKFLITGDCHGKFDRLEFLNENSKTTAIIILGDAGFNFYLNKSDTNLKKNVSSYGYTIYCVRGNHEQRPENIIGMKFEFDENVQGYVYSEDKYPLIRYFKDGETYVIEGKKALVVGGAYSIDKHLRLSNPRQDGWTGWFPNEQLSDEEKHLILTTTRNCEYDVVLSHTCPFPFRPIDAFIDWVDQSEVDTSTEEWLDDLKDAIKWKGWIFGHYHIDRLVPNKKYRIMYRDIENFSEVCKELGITYDY